MEEHYDILIYRKLKGDISSEELALLESWCLLNPQNLKRFNDYRALWNFSGTRRTVESGLLEFEKEKLMARIRKSSSGQTSLRNFSAHRKKLIAVCIVLVTVFSGLWMRSTRSLEYTQTGSRIILPDSSILVLNKASRIYFHQTQSRRDIQLYGEAFFEVKRNVLCPLFIQLDGSTIKVVGTSLLVKNYSGGNPELIVMSGSVLFIHDAITIEVSAPKKLSFDRGSKKTHSSINTDLNSDAWVTHRLVFDDTPLDQVVATLENYYGAKFFEVPENIAKCPFTGTFENEDLQVVLNIVTFTFNATYTNRNGKYLLKGEGCV